MNPLHFNISEMKSLSRSMSRKRRRPWVTYLILCLDFIFWDLDRMYLFSSEWGLDEEAEISKEEDILLSLMLGWKDTMRSAQQFSLGRICTAVHCESCQGRSLHCVQTHCPQTPLCTSHSSAHKSMLALYLQIAHIHHSHDRTCGINSPQKIEITR